MFPEVLRGRGLWRRWSYLVAGGALLMPYWFLGIGLVPAVIPFRNPVLQLVLVLLVLPLAGTFVTGLVPVVRLLEGAAAKELLGGPIAGLPVGRARTWESRIRTGTWFTLHLHAGVVISALSLAVPPFAVVLLLAPLVSWDERFLETWFDPGRVPEWPLPFGGVAMLAAVLALMVVTGETLSRAAPRLLGPSAAERLEEAEARAVRLAERNRLARELHDSVGHALSVVTLQAGAAGRVLDSDPAFAREALGAIEESARAALEDLDHVLGLLREDSGRGASAPQPTLKDLDRLLEQTRIAGVELDSAVGAELEQVPAAVSREAYRIVQEGLTNALRHAGKVPVRLRIGVRGELLEVEMSNPLGARPAGHHGGGRGLGGVRERVIVLGGAMTAGPGEDGRWRLDVSLPLRHVS